jgi:hypothetical protein
MSNLGSKLLLNVWIGRFSLLRPSNAWLEEHLVAEAKRMAASLSNDLANATDHDDIEDAQEIHAAESSWLSETLAQDLRRALFGTIWSVFERFLVDCLTTIGVRFNANTPKTAELLKLLRNAEVGRALDTSRLSEYRLLRNCVAHGMPNKDGELEVLASVASRTGLFQLSRDGVSLQPEFNVVLLDFLERCVENIGHDVVQLLEKKG